MAAISMPHMNEAAISFLMPVTLLINFSLFQYLLALYYKRRREYHGFLLLVCAFLGFATLIPFGMSDRYAAAHLNDISESASVATFLIQVTIVSRDVTRKMKLPMVRVMMVASELLTIFDIFVVVLNVLNVCGVDVSALDGVDNIAEDLSLLVIFVTRFYFLAIARGWRYLLDNKKVEITMYLLFITHEYPFVALEHATDVSWESVQALWHRTTMGLCISLTVKEKIRSSLFSNNRTTQMSQGPSNNSVKVTSVRRRTNGSVTIFPGGTQAAAQAAAQPSVRSANSFRNNRHSSMGNSNAANDGTRRTSVGNSNTAIKVQVAAPRIDE